MAGTWGDIVRWIGDTGQVNEDEGGIVSLYLVTVTASGRGDDSPTTSYSNTCCPRYSLFPTNVAHFVLIRNNPFPSDSPLFHSWIRPASCCLPPPRTCSLDSPVPHGCTPHLFPGLAPASVCKCRSIRSVLSACVCRVTRSSGWQ